VELAQKRFKDPPLDKGDDNTNSGNLQSELMKSNNLAQIGKKL